MATKAVEENCQERIERLLAYSMALPQGKTLYDIPIEERVHIHADYARGGKRNSFARDRNVLVSAGFVPNERDVIVGHLFYDIEALVSADCCDIFALTRDQLSKMLCKDSGVIARYAGTLASMLQEKHGHLPAFAQSQNDSREKLIKKAGQVCKRLTQEYNIKPTVPELARLLGVPKSTMRRWCYDYSIGVGVAYSEAGTNTLKRKIIDLERKLAHNSKYVSLLSDSELEENFPDVSVARMRCIIKELANSGHITYKSIARLHVLIVQLNKGKPLEEALKASGNSAYLCHQLRFAQRRLKQLVITGKGTSPEAKNLQSLVRQLSVHNINL